MRKFEYIFAFAILAVLAFALVLFRDESETTYLIIGTFVGGFSAITTYFFTKHKPGGDE